MLCNSELIKYSYHGNSRTFNYFPTLFLKYAKKKKKPPKSAAVESTKQDKLLCSYTKYFLNFIPTASKAHLYRNTSKLLCADLENIPGTSADAR